MRKRKIAFLSLAVLAAVAGAALCDRADKPQELDQADLQRWISHAEAGQRISLRDMTAFDWDTLYLLHPYADPKSIQGVRRMDRIPDDIRYLDDANLLIFVKDHRAIRYMKYPRAYGDFAEPSLRVLPADEAVFLVDRSTSPARLLQAFEGRTGYA
ncbi:hypothetical protein [Cohnella nanjingensis]|uniref:Lipoprotein n=1 Tax=Cohnella nanjingensis TaxID=1387779 RepID=A0A7X0RVL7_9BACL|nr:hypothetical protein [Cohnella nanjingensis]MBB6674421.1 hypothetical protein [Cohnella nanjingensis]